LSTCYQWGVGAYGLLLSYQTLNTAASRDPSTDKAYLVLRAVGWYGWEPRLCLGLGERRNGLRGGKILPAYVYHNRGMHWRELVLGLVLFKLVAPPFQSGMVESYPVHDVWFPSHLLLVETGCN
jgi:hypothetical protein